jgi:hypothetical protein
MRRKKGTDANMKFLFGSVFFFFIIVIIIGLFSYFTLQQYWSGSDEAKKVATATRPQYDYTLAFDTDFQGKSYRFYLNDSLIYAGCPVKVDTVLRTKRIAQSNSLLIVDDASDVIVSIIELGRRGDILLKYNNGAISSRIKE